MILIRHGQTEFNRVFAATRQDPGIHDPQLTDHGRRQAALVAQALRPLGLTRLIASPYTRALETAAIIAEGLDLPITVEALIAERFCFACDIGSSLDVLRARWPDLALDHLPDPWWPQSEETEAEISVRSEHFRRQITSEAWQEIGLITHWGFIRALTRLSVPNGAVLRFDPTRSNCAAEVVFIPDVD